MPGLWQAGQLAEEGSFELRPEEGPNMLVKTAKVLGQEQAKRPKQKMRVGTVCPLQSVSPTFFLSAPHHFCALWDDSLYHSTKDQRTEAP
jgi:hypothetical protein